MATAQTYKLITSISDRWLSLIWNHSRFPWPLSVEVNQTDQSLIVIPVGDDVNGTGDNDDPGYGLVEGKVLVQQSTNGSWGALQGRSIPYHHSGVSKLTKQPWLKMILKIIGDYTIDYFAYKCVHLYMYSNPLFARSYILTLPVPLMKEMRFRQTGRRIRITLKLIGRAGPRAKARASYSREMSSVKCHV